MKKTVLSILTLAIYLLGYTTVTAEDHKQKLHEIGESIKRAVKAGKITEKEGWAKWYAVLREHGHHEDDDYDDHHDEDNWEEAEELEREIEIRELEFELERLEHEHEMQRMEWNHERESMERDFDRERREWDMENMQWDMRRKHMEMQMRGGSRSGTMGYKQGHYHGFKAGDSKRGTCSHDKVKSDCDKSPCEKKGGKSCCGKCKAGCNKKESCKKGEKSCPDKKEDFPKKKRKK